MAFNPSLAPSGTLILDSGQTYKTNSREVTLALNSNEPYEVAFFVNKRCAYKEAGSWTPYESIKKIQLPEEDGLYEIHVMYRNKTHFSSACQSVKVFLDKTAPRLASVQALQRLYSETVINPEFIFDAGTDNASEALTYQRRLIAADNSVVLDWADIPVPNGSAQTVSATLPPGTHYRIQIRAKDEAGNWSAPSSSLPIYTGVQTGLYYFDDMSQSEVFCNINCVPPYGVIKMRYRLSAPLAENLNIRIQSRDITTVADVDYTAFDQNLTIPAGSTEATFLLNYRMSFEQSNTDRSFEILHETNLTSNLPASRVSHILNKTLATQRTAKVTQPSFKSVSAGTFQTCGLSTTDEVYCWGSYYTFGKEMGWKSRSSVLQVEANYGGHCVLTTTREIYCYGYQLGSFGGLLAATNSPGTVLNGFTNVRQFASTTGSSSNMRTLCAVLMDGTVRCSGINLYFQVGQSGTFTTTSVAVPGLSVAGTDPVATKVAMTEYASCALTSAGDVYCWGHNANGIAGVGTTGGNFPASKITGLPTITDIATGLNHICALSDDSRIFCWGQNSHRQAGDASSEILPTPIEIPGQSDVEYIAAGDYNTCWIRNFSGVRKVYCIGNNIAGVMGPYFNMSPVPVEVTTVPTDTVALSLGQRGRGICALTASGQIYCWGGIHGETGSWNSLGVPMTANINLTNSLGLPANDRFNQNIQDAFALGYALCIKDASNQTWCRNRNIVFSNPRSRLSNQFTFEPSLVPEAEHGITKTMEDTLCYIAANKTVWCKGHNQSGSLGNNTLVDSDTYVQVIGLSNVKFIQGGNYHVCALTESNQLYCWGRSRYGSTGTQPTAEPYATPLPNRINVPAGTIRKLLVHESGGCLLMESGRAYCWGTGGNGTLGDGTISSSRYTPSAPVTSSEKFLDIEGSHTNMCGITVTNKVLCWGWNSRGFIGTAPDSSAISTPVAIDTPIKFSSVALAARTVCAISLDKEVYCWGSGGGGQMGRATWDVSNATPKKVYNIHGAAEKLIMLVGFYDSLSAGYDTSVCVLIRMDSGKKDVKCWGQQFYNTGFPGAATATPRRMWVDADSP